MARTEKVLVIGAGIAGLTLAIALRRVGIAVDVVEIKSDVREQPGVGLSMQGNALAALGRLGLAAAVLRHGVPGCYINLRRPDGTILARQTIAPTGGPGYPGTAGISRSRLHAVLLDAATDAGAAPRLGTSFERIDDRGDVVDVRFTDGSVGHYDLVVGADGLYSKVRGLLFPDVKPRYLGQAVWRAGVKRSPGNYTTELHLGGPAGAVGLCPISEDMAYLYVVESAPAGARYPDDQLARIMGEKVSAYPHAMVQQAATQLPGSTSISYRPLEALLLDGPWHRNRVMVIGDGAHCGPPVLAQGAAMAIEDAVVLAELLAQGGALAQTLQVFNARRLPRAAMIVNNSVQLCEWEVTHQATAQDVGRIMTETQVMLCQPF